MNSLSFEIMKLKYIGGLGMTLFSFAFLLLTGCTVIEKNYPLESSLKDFNSTDSQTADSGYMELFHSGADAIPLLLGNLDSAGLFAGRVYQDTKYSFVAIAPSKGLISLYLIEAIRLNDHRPHQTPMIVSEQGEIPPNGPDAARDAYEKWWDGLQDKSTEGVRAGPDPLAGTGLVWK